MVQNLWWATGYNIVAIPLFTADVLFWAGIRISPRREPVHPVLGVRKIRTDVTGLEALA